MLRTHTSPMQVRAMEAQEPPIFIVVPGKVLPPRPVDATHSPMFHQIEGLAVAEGITLADLAGHPERDAARHLRRRAARRGCVPTTSPSPSRASSSTSPASPATARAGSTTARAATSARGSAGSRSAAPGMVDPNVFGFVADNGYDPEEVQGFAFGVGIERIAMLPHGVPDLRRFFENDVRMLEQFHEGSDMKVPVYWLQRVLRPGLGSGGARRAPGADRAPRSSASAHSAPPRRRASWWAWSRRSNRTPTPTGSASARSTPATARARSSAALPTSPPASSCRWRCRARCCPTAPS